MNQKFVEKQVFWLNRSLLPTLCNHGRHHFDIDVVKLTVEGLELRRVLALNLQRSTFNDSLSNVNPRSESLPLRSITASKILIVKP